MLSFSLSPSSMAALWVIQLKYLSRPSAFLLHWRIYAQNFLLFPSTINSLWKKFIYQTQHSLHTKWSFIPGNGMDLQKEKCLKLSLWIIDYKSLLGASSKVVWNCNSKSQDSLTHRMLEITQINLSLYIWIKWSSKKGSYFRTS